MNADRTWGQGGMNVLDDLKQRLLSARCEVCGEKAYHAALELADCEPICVDGELYPKREILGRHYFCDEHKRTYEIRPWEPPAGWTPPADWPKPEEVPAGDPHG